MVCDRLENKLDRARSERLHGYYLREIRSITLFLMPLITCSGFLSGWRRTQHSGRNLLPDSSPCESNGTQDNDILNHDLSLLQCSTHYWQCDISVIKYRVKLRLHFSTASRATVSRVAHVKVTLLPKSSRATSTTPSMCFTPAYSLPLAHFPFAHALSLAHSQYC